MDKVFKSMQKIDKNIKAFLLSFPNKSASMTPQRKELQPTETSLLVIPSIKKFLTPTLSFPSNPTLKTKAITQVLSAGVDPKSSKLTLEVECCI